MRTIYRMLFIFTICVSFGYADSVNTNFYQSYINSKIDKKNINKPLPVLKERVIPEYATAWPKKVEVLKPDPIVGDKDVWEHWIYNEEFAKRFEGFDIDKADDELKGSPIKALHVSIFKMNDMYYFYENYPRQYVVNLDIYYDNALHIPLSNNKVKITYFDSYPDGILS